MELLGYYDLKYGHEERKLKATGRLVAL